MADFGVTSTGFTPKRLADIVDSLTARLQSVQDPVTGETLQFDPTDSSVLANIVGIVAEEIAAVWSAAQLAYLQFDPRYNTGAGQSGTVQLNGIIRDPGHATVLSLALTGTDGAIIPAGSLVTTPDRLATFATTESVTIASGTATVTAACTEPGPVVVAGSTTMLIATPTAGWATATCSSTPIAGAAPETDEALRLRQQSATSTTAYRHIEAIYAAIMAVPGVTYCRVYQNATLDNPDTRSIGAKSIAAVVLGGVDEDIANALFLRTPVGIGYTGTTVITITDAFGTEYDIGFMRPTPVAIDIVVAVAKVDDSFPAATYADDIKAAIIAYAAGGGSAVGAATTFDQTGFVPGASIYRSLLYTPINSVSGHRVTTLTLAKHGESQGTSDITIAWDELATFDTANITVTRSDMGS